MLNWNDGWLKQHWNINLNTDVTVIEIIIILRFESKSKHPLPLHTWLLPKAYNVCIPYICSFYWCKVTIVISRFENWRIRLDFGLTFFHFELYFAHLDIEKIVDHLQDSNKLKENCDFAHDTRQKSTQKTASVNVLKIVRSSW